MSWLNELPHDLASALKSETRGEVIRWAGRPDPKAAFRSSLGILLFAVPWIAISLPLHIQAMRSFFFGAPINGSSGYLTPAALGAVLFTGAFVAFGAIMLGAPFILKHKARRTVHAVTDRRILTLVLNRKLVVTTVLPEKIVKIERCEATNGDGSLKVVIGHKKDSDGDIAEKAEDMQGVPRVAEAERWITELIRQHRKAA